TVGAPGWREKLARALPRAWPSMSKSAPGGGVSTLSLAGTAAAIRTGAYQARTTVNAPAALRTSAAITTSDGFPDDSDRNARAHLTRADPSSPRSINEESSRDARGGARREGHLFPHSSEPDQSIKYCWAELRQSWRAAHRSARCRSRIRQRRRTDDVRPRTTRRRASSGSIDPRSR